MIPTRPGWYRARWKGSHVNPFPPRCWCCAEVDDDGYGLVVWSEMAHDFVVLDEIAEWGERVDMPDEGPG